MNIRIIAACAAALLMLAPDMASATTLRHLSSQEIAELERNARAGDVAAMERLADVFHYELTQHSVPDSRKRAIYWYQRAVDAGDVDAQLELCFLFEDGDRWPGVAPDEVRAEAWCRRAAYAGNVHAQVRMGYYYENPAHQDYRQAREWTLKSARQGYEYSGERLDLVYSYGNKVTTFDEVWQKLENEAAAGDAEAQWRLGEIYADEDLGRQDEALARKWLQASADQGNAMGQYYLAWMELREAIDAHDEARKAAALALMRKSADQGNIWARLIWARFYESDLDIADDQNERLIFNWWLDGAERGYAEAQESLVDYYQRGVFVDADGAEAWKWHLIASHTPARSGAPQYGDGPSDDIKTEGQRRADAWIAAHPVPEWMPED